MNKATRKVLFKHFLFSDQRPSTSRACCGRLQDQQLHKQQQQQPAGADNLSLLFTETFHPRLSQRWTTSPPGKLCQTRTWGAQWGPGRSWSQAPRRRWSRHRPASSSNASATSSTSAATGDDTSLKFQVPTCDENAGCAISNPGIASCGFAPWIGRFCFRVGR